jgi:transcriptional regulator with XRE-family HTH domain
MATAELSVVFDDHDSSGARKGPQPGQPLHRIQEVRRQQGMTVRTVARRMSVDMRTIRMQEQAAADLRLTDLYRWQEALEVPIDELLVEGAAPLSRPVQERAKLLRIMKTAVTLLETAAEPATKRLAENLVEQLTDLMPELREVSAWHSVGQRRSLDEMGRIATQTYSAGSLDGDGWDD